MNSELLARLMAADPAERQWLLLKSAVEALSPEVRQAVWSIAVPHWFDDRILAALCPELATQAVEIYQELQALSFVEVFEGRGHNIHEATRSLLLDRLWNDRPEEFKLISARAAEYFEDDAENVAEWLYHKSIGEPIGNAMNQVMQPLNNQFRRSESEVILKALDEQIVIHRVESAVAAEVAYWQGELHRRFYEADEALENYRLAIEIYRQVGARLGEANTLKAIADVLQFKDQRDEALENYRLAIEIYRQVGDRLGEANCLQEFGNLEEDIDKKLQFFQDSQQIYVAIGDRYSQSRNLRFIARAQESQGNPSAALASWTLSRDLAIEIQYEPFQASAQEAIDRLLRETRSP